MYMHISMLLVRVEATPDSSTETSECGIRCHYMGMIEVPKPSGTFTRTDVL